MTCGCIIERRWEGPSCWVSSSTDELIEAREELVEKAPWLKETIAMFDVEIGRRNAARADHNAAKKDGHA